MKYTTGGLAGVVACAILLMGCGEPPDNPSVPQEPDPAPVMEPEPVPEAPEDGDEPPLSPVVREGACPRFEACGGELDGSWQWDSWCQAPESKSMTCSGAVSATTIQPSGVLRFDADKTYELHASLARHDELTVPRGCGQGRGCESLSQSLSLEAGTEWACGDEGPSCDCQSDATTRTDENGTWDVEGLTVTLKSSEGQTRFFGYCVAGDVLMLQELTLDSDLPLIELTR